MKNSSILILVIVISSLLYSCTASQPESNTSTTVPTVFIPARDGDSVFVIVNYVKGDKKEQFEKFIHESFWPKAQGLSEADKQLFRQTRILHPTKQEADGTYIYMFVMDPYFTGHDYSIENMLRKMYGDKWEEPNRMFGESLAREQSQYMMLQNKYYTY
jgi:hypothetical protein